MMASYIIRRAFSRHILFLLPTSVLHVCENSLVKLCISDSTTRVFTLPNMPNFITESRRSFAKGRKPKDEGGVSTVVVPSDIGPTIKAYAASQMESAMDALSFELSKLRIGISSARMLDQEATTLYSFRSQAQRLEALHEFKSGKVPILLATDVAGRSLDIPTVVLVINYDVPRIPRDYIHCVGRTARACRERLALSLITQNDVDLVREI